MKLRNILITTAAISAIAAATAMANTVSSADFVKKASISNQFEVKSSKLALEKSQNEDVKEFAEQMIDDHTAVGEKLEETLDKAEMDIEPEDTLDNRHQQLLQKLQNTSGAEFDRQYIAIQTNAHQEAVNLFSTYAQSGKDKELKNFASQTLPDLQQHLQHVQQLDTQR